jgi:hypothetical protein
MNPVRQQLTKIRRSLSRSPLPSPQAETVAPGEEGMPPEAIVIDGK